MAQFPLMKGRKTSKDSRYLDALPVNMIPIPSQAPNASGYLRSFKGIQHLYDCDGVSMSANYNDLTNNEYRILGSKFYKDGQEVAQLDNPVIANMCHSRYSQAFVDDGKVKYFRDGKVTELKNWAEGENYTKSPATNYDLTGVIDVDRHQGRYVWINKQRFGCTALAIGSTGDQSVSPEQRPDYIAPLYSPESDPDNNKAIRSCFGKYVAVFARHTTEYFVLTGDANNLYSAQKNMECQCGVVATGAVCVFGGAFAAIGSGKRESLAIVLITPSKYQKISTATVDKVLVKYKESELKSALCESITMDNHQLLFVHLPNETLVYDGSQNIWFTLKSSIVGDGPYTGRHIIYNHEEGLTIGDSQTGRMGLLTDAVASQYDNEVEHLLYTPFVKVNAGRGKVPLYDLSLDSIKGYSAKTQRLWISVTLDGRVYGNELLIDYNELFEYTNKVLLSNLGSVEDMIGFKLRWVTKDNVSISGFNVRVGYGG